MAAGIYRYTFSFSFRIGNDGCAWNWLACVKDTESKDGLGLPGQHGCGARKVSATVDYLG
jgi:hypothetical protein